MAGDAHFKLLPGTARVHFSHSHRYNRFSMDTFSNERSTKTTDRRKLKQTPLERGTSPIAKTSIKQLAGGLL